MSGARESLRRWLSAGLTLAVLGWGAWYLRRHAAELHWLTRVSPWALAVVLAARVAHFLCNGLQIQIVTRSAGLKLRFVEAFGLSRVTHFTNLVLPVAGGAPLRAVYLNREHGLSYTAFLALSAWANVVKLVVVALGGLVFLLPVAGRAPLAVALTAGCAAAGAAAYAVGGWLPERWLSAWPPLARLAGEWHRFRTDRRLLLELAAVYAVGFALVALDVWASFRAFGVPLSPAACAVVSSLTALAAIPNLVPANVGIREALFVSIAAVYGSGVNEGLHAAAASRLVGTVVALALAPGFLLALGRRRGQRA
jgi:uncharacterized membrane protein YbhN (UPF0104 family)